jgi:hypothetical protein
MNEVKILASASHDISIHLFNEEKSNDCKWVERHLEERRGFFSRKTIDVPGHYVDCYGAKISGPDYFTREDYHSAKRYKIKKTGEKDEVPSGTLFNKACVKIVLVGGEYTSEEWFYFDSFKEASDFVDNIERMYPNKFLIVSEARK